jgi:hypothetical protein
MSARPHRPSRRYRVKALQRLPDQHFPFLRLPAELHNRVYDFTFVAPDGIKLRWQTGKNRRAKKPVMVVDSEKDSEVYPINQLQYVNRQLRKETAGLEIQHNRVIMGAYPKIKGDAIRSLLVFAYSCTPTRLSWLTEVTLSGLTALADQTIRQRHPVVWVTDHLRDFAKLLRLYLEASHVTVNLHLPWFAFSNEDGSYKCPVVFITESILLSRLLRGKDLSSIELGVNAIKKHDTFLSKMAGYRKADLETYGRAAPNLRLRPTDEHFAEDAFRERLHLDVNELPLDPAFQSYLAGGGAELWVKYARKWIANGI